MISKRNKIPKNASGSFFAERLSHIVLKRKKTPNMQAAQPSPKPQNCQDVRTLYENAVLLYPKDIELKQLKVSQLLQKVKPHFLKTTRG
jgi:hypothetical protein